MTDAAWDQVYSAKGMAAYPDNALIRFVARHYYDAPDRAAVRFIDVGCGAGPSAWYLAREGFSVMAIDASEVAIARLRKRLAHDHLVAVQALNADIVDIGFGAAIADAVIDVSSLCYVPIPDIGRVMRKLYRSLKAGGRMFSLTPATDCAPELFQDFADSVKVRARFAATEEAAANFREFRHVSVSPYRYWTNGKQASLWAIEALK